MLDQKKSMTAKAAATHETSGQRVQALMRLGELLQRYVGVIAGIIQSRLASNA